MVPFAPLLLAGAPLCTPTPASIQESHLGVPLTTVRDLPRPVSVAFGPGDHGVGVLLVAVRGDVDEPPCVVLVDVPDEAAVTDGAVPRRAGTLGAGVLERPSGLAVDERGHVYVTDELQHALWRFPANGGPPERLASSDVLTLPADVDVRIAGDVPRAVVADAGSGTIRLGDLAAGTWRTLGEAELVRPIAVTFFDDDAGVLRIAVCDGARHRVEIYGIDGEHVAGFGDWGAFPTLLSTPSGIVYSGGRLFVADTENHRVQAFESREIDGEVGHLAYRFGLHAIRPGEGDGALHYPSAIDIDASATWLALAEPLDDRVQLFTRGPGAEPVEDKLRAAIGPPTAHLGPTISASDQYIATVSPESHRVQIHDLRFEEPVRISEAFGFGERLGMLRGPVATHLTANGTLLLTVDDGNRRLTRTELRVRPGEPLAQDPELARHLESVDLQQLVGRPFVPGAVTVTSVDSLGQSVLVPPRIAIADRATDAVVLLDIDLGVAATFQGDETTGPIRGIAGLATSVHWSGKKEDLSHGLLWVVDSHGAGTPGSRGGRVIEFDSAGKVRRTFGEGILGEPDGIAALENGEIWVTDRASDRVEVFVQNDDGSIEHARGFGERGLGRAQFHDPRGVAVLGDGRVVVVDHGNHRGQIFDAEGNFLKGFGGRLYVEPLK